ncbi:hypothetical protein [Bacillus coahuilensis]|nr:hypothetical protein [Bacillus coahuilensis]
MNLLWGVLMILAGLFLLVFGTVKSDFIIYRLLVALGCPFKDTMGR